MTKTLAKATYYVTERKTFEKEKKYQIDYIIIFGAESLTHTIKVRKNLRSIDLITDEEHIRWKKSLDKDDFFKEQDYKIISKALTQLGQGLRAIGEMTKKEYFLINKDARYKKYGERNLKSFEEEILMKAYNGL